MRGLPDFVKRASRAVTVSLAAVFFFAACSGPEKVKPVDLGPDLALLGVKSVWSSSIGAVTFPLQARVVGNTLFVAGSNGTVAAMDASTGGDLWRLSVGTSLSAGVGADGRYVAVVSRDNELIVLDANKEIWRQKLGAVTLTAPLVAGARVFVLSGDRAVSAFDVSSGRRLWQQQRTGEALVLGRSGILMAFGDTLVAGVGGRLVGMNPADGKTRWEVQVANSRGTNEVERLVDLVSGVSRQGSKLCVRAFQSAVGCVDAGKGSLNWSKTASGSTGLSGDGETLFGSESDGRLTAWRVTDGERLWTSERLRFRSLTGPTLSGRALVVGDDAGILHFLSRQDGGPLTRMVTDGSPIVSSPVLVDQTLIAITQRGGVFGFRPE